MKMNKKYLALLVVALMVFTAFGFFFYHFGHNDTVALTDFMTAYGKFDQAAADFSKSSATSNADLESKADEALAVLNTKASARISSLTRNEAEAMSAMREIADLATQELAALKEYKTGLADGSGDVSTLLNTFEDLTRKRQAAYTRFRALGGS